MIAAQFNDTSMDAQLTQGATCRTTETQKSPAKVNTAADTKIDIIMKLVNANSSINKVKY